MKLRAVSATVAAAVVGSSSIGSSCSIIVVYRGGCSRRQHRHRHCSRRRPRH